MMKLLALCLFMSSLAAAGVLSPSPEKKIQGNDDVIVKDGHRVIIVETFDENGHHNTKISISPPHETPNFIHSTEETIKEASSALPNLGQGISPGRKYPGESGQHTAGELICDALGKCRHKIAETFGKASETVSETAGDVREKIAETVHDEIATKRQMARDAKDTVKEKTQDLREGTREAVDKAKETGKEAIDKAKETGKEAIGKAAEKGRNLRSHIASNVSETVEDVRESASEFAKGAKETTEEAAEKAKSGTNKFFDVLKNMLGLDSLMGVLNLLGFATAYGTSVWVTFVSSYLLAQLLPRQQFALVQSKTYPVYFRVLGGSIGLALLGHLLGQRSKVFSSKSESFQAYNLLSSLLMVLVNALYLEPRANKVMHERMRLEKEEGRGRERSYVSEQRVGERRSAGTTATTAVTREETMAAAATTAEQEAARSRMGLLSERLKKLNSYSSLLNVVTLMGLTWHLVYLGQRLGVGC